MSRERIATRRGVGAVLQRLTDVLVEPPACVICGRGHASTGWVVDPFGRIFGRCPGCVEDWQAERDEHRAGHPALTG